MLVIIYMNIYHTALCSFEVLDVKGHYPHISHPEVTIERLKHYVKEG